MTETIPIGISLFENMFFAPTTKIGRPSKYESEEERKLAKKEQAKKYRENNKEKVSERTKIYNELNKDKITQAVTKKRLLEYLKKHDEGLYKREPKYTRDQVVSMLANLGYHVENKKENSFETFVEGLRIADNSKLGYENIETEEAF